MRIKKRQLLGGGALALSLIPFSDITAQAETAVEETPVEKSFDREKSVVVSQTEIPRSKYTITAKVDKNNELPKNNEKDSSWVFHTNQIHIEMNDLTGLKEGSTITFFKNGNYGQWNGDVTDSNGTVIGTIKTEQIGRTIREVQFDVGDLPADAIKPENSTAMYRTTITFNKEIEKETRKNLTIDLETRYYTGFEHVDGLITTYSTIRDSENKILDSAKLYINPSSMVDNKNPYEQKDMNLPVFVQHTTTLNDGTWNNRVFSGMFNIYTGHASLYKKGTKFKFTKNPDSGLQYSFKEAYWAGGTDHPNEKLIEHKDATLVPRFGGPDSYVGSPTINHRYVKDGPSFKVRVTEITDDVLELELLEDMPRMVSEYKWMWWLPDDKVSGDINQYLDKDGNYNNKPYAPYKVSITNDRGWKGEYTWGTKIEIFWAKSNSTGEFKPVYETVVDATHNGKVIKQNVGKSPGLRPEGTDISIDVEKSIQVDGLWYKPTTPTITLKQEGRTTRKQVEYILDEEKNLAKVNVTIKHIGTDGKVLKSDIKTNVLEKTDYTSDSEQFPGYKLKSEPAVKQGKVGKKDIELVYTYEPLARINVTTKHINVRTGEVLKSSVQNNIEENTAYTTQPESIVDYNLVSTPENAKGTAGVSDITVEYRYKYLRTASVKQRFVDTKGTRLQDDVITEKQIPGDKLALKYPEKLIYNGSQYLIKHTPNSDVTLRDGEMVLTYIYDVDPATINPHNPGEVNDPNKKQGTPTDLTDSDQIKRLNDEIKRLQDDLKRSQGDDNKLQDEIKRLQDDLKRSQGNDGKLQDEIKRLQDELKRNQGNDGKLQDELKRLQDELKRNQDELKRNQGNDGKLQDELRRLQDEIKRLQDELKRTQGNNDSKLQDELKRLQDELKRNQDELKRSQGDDSKLQDELKRLQDELKRTQGNNDSKLQDELKRLQDELKRSQDNDNKLQDELKRLQDELKRTRSNVDNIQDGDKPQDEPKQTHDSDDSELQDEIKQLEDDINKAIKNGATPEEIAKLQARIDHLRKQGVSSDIINKLQKLLDKVKGTSATQSSTTEQTPNKTPGKKLPETGDPVGLASFGIASLIGARKLRRKK